MSANSWYKFNDKQRKYLKAKDRQNKMCEFLYAYDNNLKEQSGIYILTRVNKPTESGKIKKFAYIGQAKSVIDRLAQHYLMFSQRIDISLKTRGLYYPSNPYAWRIKVIYCEEDELDYLERFYITEYSNNGYELYNITSGGQCGGKNDINERQEGKGYHDGLKQGYENCLNEIREYFSKYLDFVVKEPILNKKGRPFAVKSAKYEKFSELMKGKSEENDLQKEN